MTTAPCPTSTTLGPPAAAVFTTIATGIATSVVTKTSTVSSTSVVIGVVAGGVTASATVTRVETLTSSTTVTTTGTFTATVAGKLSPTTNNSVGLGGSMAPPGAGGRPGSGGQGAGGAGGSGGQPGVGGSGGRAVAGAGGSGGNQPVGGSGGRSGSAVAGSGGRGPDGVGGRGGTQGSGGGGSGGSGSGGVQGSGGRGSGGNPGTGGARGTGGAGTGGATTPTTTTAVNCSGPPLSGGSQHCSSNGSGTSGNYTWTLWMSGSGGCITPYGVGAAFKATWNNSGDFLARMGFQWSSSQTFDQLGTISADYAFTKSGNGGGYSYIGIYGWSQNPLREYYIVDDWFSKPNPGTKVGTITVDGGTYDVIKNTRVNQPSIEGTSTFDQFFSVRQTARQCGHISVSQHFSEWAKLGLQLGKMYEAKILVEAGGGSGTVDFTSASMSTK